MTNMHEVNFGMNKYCGPAVLSVLTGESTDRCAAVISAVSGKQVIKAVERQHLRAAFKRLRFEVEDTLFSGSTLFGVLHRMQASPGQYIVFVPHHVIAVQIKDSSEIYICDNHTKSPLDIKQSARLMQKVEMVWRVVAKDPPKFSHSEIVVRTGADYISVYEYNYYEKEEDNTSYMLGSLKVRDQEQLDKIINQLQRTPR